MAAALGRRKAENIQATRAEACITANIGCQFQIQRALAAAGTPLPVMHVIELLDESYK